MDEDREPSRIDFVVRWRVNPRHGRREELDAPLLHPVGDVRQVVGQRIPDKWRQEQHQQYETQRRNGERQSGEPAQPARQAEPPRTQPIPQAAQFGRERQQLLPCARGQKQCEQQDCADQQQGDGRQQAGQPGSECQQRRQVDGEQQEDQGILVAGWSAQPARAEIRTKQDQQAVHTPG
jgi:hypothetical protein